MFSLKYELKKAGKVFTSKSVGSGPSSYKKRIYRAAVSQRFRNTVLEDTFVLHNPFSVKSKCNVRVVTVKNLNHDTGVAV